MRTSIFIWALLLLTVFSCSEKKTTRIVEKTSNEAPHDTISDSSSVVSSIINSDYFNNKVFIQGKGQLENTCQVENRCDCCTSDLLFISPDIFVQNNFCEGNEWVIKGKYIIKGNNLALHYHPEIVKYEYNWEHESDSTAVAYHLTSEKKSLPVISFSIEICKADTMLKTTSGNNKEIAILNSEASLNDKIKVLKEKGIWNKLGLD